MVTRFCFVLPELRLGVHTLLKSCQKENKGGGRAGKIVYLVLGALGVPMT